MASENGTAVKVPVHQKDERSISLRKPLEWLVDVSHLEQTQCKYWGPGESFEHSPRCSHWRQSRTPTLCLLCLWRAKHKSLHWAYNRHLQMVVPSHAADRNVPGFLFHQRQGLTLDYMAEVDSLPWTSWSLPALKKHWIGNFDSVTEMASETSGNWTGLTRGAPVLRSYIYQDVSEPTCRSFSTTGMYAGKSLLSMGYEGLLSICGNHYVVVKRNWVLREFHCSESVVVFHLVYWMSSFLGVVLVLFVLGLVFALFALSEDIRLFAFHLFSYNLRIVDRPQDVLMTVRASSAYGMS